MDFSMTAVFLFLLALYAHVTTCDNTLGPRVSCNENFGLCGPKGASTLDEPSVGTALSSFYVDIVNTVDSNKNGKRDLSQGSTLVQARGSGGSLCCADGTQCLLLQGLNLPFCYDNYTTNYFLPGGSYGQIVSGNYTSSDGSSANLISGNYTLMDGAPGNIYGSVSSPSKPDTATLAIPTQYTSSGSGSAIPVTALGQEITYTTTIPGTTIPPSVVPETVTIPIISGSNTVGSVVTPGPSSTIPGTTVAPETSTITTRFPNASPTKKSSAIISRPCFSLLVGMTFLRYLPHFWVRG